MELAAEYGLFLAKTLTLVLAFVAVVAVIAAAARKGSAGAGEHLKVDHLNKRFERLGDALRHGINGKGLRKSSRRARRRVRLNRRPRTDSACSSSISKAIFAPAPLSHCDRRFQPS